MRRATSRGIAIAATLLLLVAAGPAAARSGASDSPGALTYVGAGVANVFYIPAKVVFALLGGFASGAAYVFTAGDADASTAVWNSSVNGSYVVTPRMIQGKEPVRFVGP